MEYNVGKRKDSTFEELEAKRVMVVGRLLFYCFKLFLDRGMTKLQRRGHNNIGMAQSVLLRNLDFSGTQITVIAKRAGVTKQAIIKIARDLQARGYLKVVPDPNDRRGKLVRLTPRGLRLVNDVLEVAAEVEGEFAAIIGWKKLENLRATLTSLLKADLPPA